MPYVVKVNREKCTGCGSCVTICPVAVLELESNLSKVVRQQECIGCMACVEGCPEGAITVTEA